jgi:hypothetical protein
MSAKGREPDKRISFATEKHAGEFLFSSKEMNDSQFMDMRTRIVSEDTMKGLLFYGVLFERLECKAAGELKDMIERMLIARDGTGREEAVSILRQNLPRVREVDKGRGPDLIDRGRENT